MLCLLLLMCYLVWSHRPPAPEMLEYKYGGTSCDIRWTCPTSSTTRLTSLCPVSSMTPVKQYLVQMSEDGGQWRTVATRTSSQPQKYRVENLRIGSEVEFRVVSVNILGRRSCPGDISPTFNVVGEMIPYFEDESVELIISQIDLSLREHRE